LSRKGQNREANEAVRLVEAAMVTRLDDAPVVPSLAALRKAESECRRCPLYKYATQAVPGEGPARARIMLVGEQPGDKEDLAGKPFVGPAGRVCSSARWRMREFRAAMYSSPTR